MPVFRYKRKEEKLSKEPRQEAGRLVITKVEKLDEKIPMRCITVDNESGCFLIGDYPIVTHNSFLTTPFIMAKSLLFPNHHTYLMAPTGGQASLTFSKLEDTAKGNIASLLGTTSVFLDECVRANAKASPFVHEKNANSVKLFNGSDVTSLSGVAKNIVGVKTSGTVTS